VSRQEQLSFDGGLGFDLYSTRHPYCDTRRLPVGPCGSSAGTTRDKYEETATSPSRKKLWHSFPLSARMLN
jgi:hypothetical protein